MIYPDVNLQHMVVKLVTTSTTYSCKDNRYMYCQYLDIILPCILLNIHILYTTPNNQDYSLLVCDTVLLCRYVPVFYLEDRDSRVHLKAGTYPLNYKCRNDTFQKTTILELSAMRILNFTTWKMIHTTIVDLSEINIFYPSLIFIEWANIWEN
jgi:hypothetical protein